MMKRREFITLLGGGRGGGAIKTRHQLAELCIQYPCGFTISKALFSG
jgi:hypothetical protein